MGTIHTGALACAALAAMLAPTQAPARAAFLDMKAQGPGVCQAALPAFEGQVRKRPLALQNEGTAIAFVSCAVPQFTAAELNDPDFGVTVTFVNSSATAATINCTGVSFSYGAGGLTIAYIPKSVAVPAGTQIDSPYALKWDEIDTPGAGPYTTVSCALPPGTGVASVHSANGLVLIPD